MLVAVLMMGLAVPALAAENGTDEVIYYEVQDGYADENPDCPPPYDFELFAPIVPISEVQPLFLSQVSNFIELENAINSAANNVDTRIEIIADFAFDGVISIPRNHIITLYASGNHRLTAPHGARHFSVSGTLNLQNGIALVSNGGNGGGVSIGSGGILHMSGNAEISGNIAHSDTSSARGGGVTNSGTIIMTDNATIRNNTVSSTASAVYGGGVNTSGSSSVLRMYDNTTITGNLAHSTVSAVYGGGVNFGHGRITMSDNAAITNNSAISVVSAAYGGGIYQHGGVFEMFDSSSISGNAIISENIRMAVGGGIHVGYSATFNMTDHASVTNNQAGTNGGGVWMAYTSTMNLSGMASVSNNTANGSGGGINISHSSRLNMNGGRIYGNTAQNGGGISASNNSPVNIVSGEISGNTAHGNGGGISAYRPILTVGADAVFFDNSASMGFPYRTPASDAIYEQNIRATRWTIPYEQGFNNYDIIYRNETTVTFDGNGGTPNTETRRIAYGTSVGADMPSDPTRMSHRFVEWNIERDGTGYTFDGETIVRAPIRIFAIWESLIIIYPEPPVTYVVIYRGNGHTAGYVPVDENEYNYGDTVIVLSEGDLQREGYDFIGWNTEADGSGTALAVGDTFVITSDMVLYAQWEAVPYEPYDPYDPYDPYVPCDPCDCEPYDPILPTYVTVTFDGAGGFVLPENRTRQTTSGSALTVYMPTAAPVRSGYDFRGWTAQPNGAGDVFTSTTVVYEDMTVFAYWTEIPAPPPEHEGRLLVTNMSQETRERLSGSVFGVFNSMTDERIMELETDRFGEAAATLPVGDYFLRQTTAPSGYQLNMNRINFRIRANEITEVIVFNSPYPTETPPPADELGRLLVTAVAEGSRDTLQGVVFGLYDSRTNERIDRLTTDRFGEAFRELPAGDYFLRQISVPDGFILSTERINVRIRAGALTEVTVVIRAEAPQETPPNTPPTAPPTTPPTAPPTTPPTTTPPSTPPATTPPTTTPPSTPPTQPPATPPVSATPDNQGMLRVITRAEQSGNMLSGVTFGVYRVSDGVRVADLATNLDGLATLRLPASEYYLRNLSAPFGFLPEQSRVFFTVTENGTVTVDITLLRDGNALYADDGKITLPQTGELLPIVNYVLGAMLILTALLFGAFAIRSRKQRIA